MFQAEPSFACQVQEGTTLISNYLAIIIIAIKLIVTIIIPWYVHNSVNGHNLYVFAILEDQMQNAIILSNIAHAHAHYHTRLAGNKHTYHWKV